MKSRIFKIAAACFTLLLYLSTMVASDVVALTCHCLTHHCAENHTHTTHSSCSCCSHSHFVDLDCRGAESECNSPAILSHLSDSCCEHDHSNHIALYTYPRSGEDELSLHYIEVVAVVNDIITCVKQCDALHKSNSYGVYLLPPLSAAYSSSFSLRAPPALV